MAATVTRIVSVCFHKFIGPLPMGTGKPAEISFKGQREELEQWQIKNFGAVVYEIYQDSKLTITTNNHPRELLSGYELTEKERASVDYIDDEELAESSYRFFRYRGEIYDTHNFSRIAPRSSGDMHAIRADNDSPLSQWDAAQSDSYFSGIVYRYLTDDEVDHYGYEMDHYGYVIVGTYIGS